MAKVIIIQTKFYLGYDYVINRWLVIWAFWKAGLLVFYFVHIVNIFHIVKEC